MKIFVAIFLIISLQVVVFTVYEQEKIFAQWDQRPRNNNGNNSLIMVNRDENEVATADITITTTSIQRVWWHIV